MGTTSALRAPRARASCIFRRASFATSFDHQRLALREQALVEVVVDLDLEGAPELLRDPAGRLRSEHVVIGVVEEEDGRVGADRRGGRVEDVAADLLDGAGRRAQARDRAEHLELLDPLRA